MPHLRTAERLGLLLVLTLTAAGCGSARTEIGKGAEYVALGDSYTAGAGMEPIADEGCRRSARNYPSLVDQALAIQSFADRSCAAARLVNLEQAQRGVHGEVNAPQLDSVGKDTALVTIGMGLNDHAVSAGLLLVCVISPPHTEPNDLCRQYLAQPESVIDAQIRKGADDLAEALGTIADKAPTARIVVVGYPRVAPVTGSCPDRFPVPAAQLTRLRQALRVANEAWRAAAGQAGAAYVDMYAASEGHDICSDDPWIAGYLGVPGKAQGLHPFPAYAQAVADEIVKVWDD
jgi:lysophospholipase L1-like esterase